MHILLVTSEATPFAKTGGLADVCGALPLELARLGQRVTVIMPAYRSALECGQQVTSTDVRFSIPIGSKVVEGGLLASRMPAANVPVYLVQNDDYYDRPSLYGERGKDYIDNCERFVFFCRAVLESIRQLELQVDVIHAHDWQTGLVPTYLKIEYRGVPRYEHITSLLTVHNLAYQGQFWHWDMALTGLDWKYFNWQQMEFFGNLSLLKTGLVFADAINTVSPRYAEEIQGAEQGCGLEGVLQQRRDLLRGIVNGVDYQQWDPASDPHLPVQFDRQRVAVGKAACKAALQRELELPERPDVPLVSFIGRLSEQKGIDLILAVLGDWVEKVDLQWVILGTGDPKYHAALAKLAELYPKRVAVRLEFCEPLAHRIEAGSDIFLMPSRFEPCGLNQLYSLRFGTVPVVRETGGLADTIVNTMPETLEARTATGFSFREYRSAALAEALKRACEAYRQPAVWSQLIATGMSQDWSWSRSAKQYVSLYESTVKRMRQTVRS